MEEETTGVVIDFDEQRPQPTPIEPGVTYTIHCKSGNSFGIVRISGTPLGGGTDRKFVHLTVPYDQHSVLIDVNHQGGVDTKVYNIGEKVIDLSHPDLTSVSLKHYMEKVVAAKTFTVSWMVYDPRHGDLTVTLNVTPLPYEYGLVLRYTIE